MKDLKEEYLKGNLSDLVWSEILDRKIKTVSNHAKKISMELENRYEFSNYLIDSNKFRFRKVVRILALIMLFIKSLKKKIQIKKGKCIKNSNIETHDRNKNIPKEFLNEKYLVTVGKSYKVGKSTTIQCKPGFVINLTDSDINEALNYFFRKATLEVKQFGSPNLY